MIVGQPNKVWMCMG